MRISRGTRIFKILAGREIPEAWQFPKREKFEAIREGGNGNFLLNIPDWSEPQRVKEDTARDSMPREEGPDTGADHGRSPYQDTKGAGDCLGSTMERQKYAAATRLKPLLGTV